MIFAQVSHFAHRPVEVSPCEAQPCPRVEGSSSEALGCFMMPLGEYLKGHVEEAMLDKPRRWSRGDMGQ